LKRLSPIRTAVSARKVRTSLAGTRKLKPWTGAPLEGESETNVITPTTVASLAMAGAPLVPYVAGASVWMTFRPIASFLKPETAPFVTDASSATPLCSSSWVRSRAGKPRMCTASPICPSLVEMSIAE